MRRKNRKWVVLAVALYVFILWRAWRWGSVQRLPDGNILVHLERQELRRRAAERAKQAAAAALPQPEPNGESRLTAAEPAYVAVRYDDAHVVFIVASDTESRFSTSPNIQSGELTRVPAPRHPAAAIAGLQELWEPDPQMLHFFPQIIQTTPRGQQWNLSLSPDAAIPVMIERVIVAPTGCTLGLGFLASVPPDRQAAFAASSQEYFVVRHALVENVNPPVQVRIGEITDFTPKTDFYQHIEQQLSARMKQELNALNPRVVTGSDQDDPSATTTIASLHQGVNWLKADRALARGESKITYDLHAFRLTPDGTSRIYIRARWTLDRAPVFLMTAWFKMGPIDASFPNADAARPPQPTLLFSDSSWSRILREREAPAVFGKDLNFQSVLNEFDSDRDGWAELLIHSQEGNSTTITPYLYTDKGLVPLKMQYRREERSAESCLNQ